MTASTPLWLAAAGGATALGLSTGIVRTGQAAALLAVVAIVFSWILMAGAPAWPPAAPVDAVAWAAAAAALVGLALDALHAPRWAAAVAAAAAGALLPFWLDTVLPAVTELVVLRPEAAFWLGGSAAAAVLLEHRIGAPGAGGGVGALIAAGLAAVAVLAGVPGIAAAGAVAAVLGGRAIAGGLAQLTRSDRAPARSVAAVSLPCAVALAGIGLTVAATAPGRLAIAAVGALALAALAPAARGGLGQLALAGCAVAGAVLTAWLTAPI